MRLSPAVSPTAYVCRIAIVAAILMTGAAFGDDLATINTRLPKQSTANGSVAVSMIGQWVTAPTDTFTLQKQYFTGSTSCASGGGAITLVTGVSAANPHAIAIASTDSVLLTAFPVSDKNGASQSFQNPDAATLTYIGNYTVCVAGFDNATKRIQAQYAPAAQTMDGTCTSPKFLFNAGDSICVRYAGLGASGGSPWHVSFSGGVPNQCNQYASLPQTNLSTEAGQIAFTLPASNAAIPGTCSSGSNTTDIRGGWQARIDDFGNNYRAGDQFRLHSASPLADISVYCNSATDLSGSGSGFPPTGYIVVPITVGNGSGPDAASNVQLVVTMPSGTTFQSFSQTSGTPFTCGAPSGLTITCTAASLPADNWANFKLTVYYSGKSAGTTMTTTATVSSSTADLTTADHASTADATTPNPANSGIGQFVCRPDITVNSTSSSGAVVNYNSYTFSAPLIQQTGYFATTATYTGGYFAPTPASGTTFPIGDTVVAINAGIAGTGQCIFHVIVNDGQHPDLKVVKSHANNFFRNQSPATYTINVSNVGGLSTSGTVTVKDSLPEGFLALGMNGTGWSCSTNTMTCTRSDSLASGGSYPPITVSVKIPYYFAYSNTPTNKAFVSGGGQTFTANDESDDLTPVTNVPVANAVVSDFNADGKTDIVLRNYATGQDALWLMNGTTLSSIVDLPALPNTNYRIEGTADFNGDGQPDILLRNYSTGQDAVWLMNGTSVASIVDLPALPNTSYHFDGTGDFNGDGKPDILVRNYSTGQNAIWLMNGTALSSIVDLPILTNTGWQFESCGDFNGDGKTDIVLRNYYTGQNAIWLMNGTSFSSIVDLPALTNINYYFTGVADMNGDGKPDIILRNYTTGQDAVWLMNGTTLSTIVDLPALTNTSYEFDGPR